MELYNSILNYVEMLYTFENKMKSIEVQDDIEKKAESASTRKMPVFLDIPYVYKCTIEAFYFCFGFSVVIIEIGKRNAFCLHLCLPSLFHMSISLSHSFTPPAPTPLSKWVSECV